MYIFKNKFIFLIATVFLLILLIFKVNIDFNEKSAYQSELSIEPVIESSDDIECSNNTHTVSIGFNDSNASPNASLGCDAIACINPVQCGPTGPCEWRETCNLCSCQFKQSAYGGSDRCG